jgi:putative component of membrane protein insertase Oxa1/YidC/SpoIIIJ protein YidD
MIRIYWYVTPPKMRRQCLFSESCSNYVYRTTQEKGFKAGINALRRRYYQCRPGYKLEKKATDWDMILADGTTIKNEEISKSIREGFD